MTEDLLHGWDMEAALQRALNDGWDTPHGRTEGIGDLLRRLQDRRESILNRYHLQNVFGGLAERLNDIVRRERRALDDRVANADVSRREMVQRIVASRRERLSALPPDLASALRALDDYEFVDRSAEADFRAVMDELGRAAVSSRLAGASARIQGLSSAQVSALAGMIGDLNDLLRQRDEGVPGTQVDAGYQAFRDRWGDVAEDLPHSLDGLIRQMVERAVRLEAMLRSLPPDMRRQFAELSDAAIRDPHLRTVLAELGHRLAALSATDSVVAGYRFLGQEAVGIDEAMALIDDLRDGEEVERAIRYLHRGEPLSDAVRQRLRRDVGPGWLVNVERVERAMVRLETRGLVRRTDARIQLSPRGIRRIGLRALEEIFGRTRSDRFGQHRSARVGIGTELAPDSRPLEPDADMVIHVADTIMNAIRRRGSRGGAILPLDPNDIAVQARESSTRSATVLLLDMSRSMPLRGYLYAAKKVAIAFDALIRLRYPHDTLHVVGFSDRARRIPPSALAQLTVDECVYGTNLQHGLIVARELLAHDHCESRQIIVISDGEPTAHMENGEPVFAYPPSPATIQRTLDEVRRCTRDGIVMNTFMLETNESLVDFVNTVSRVNHGRAFFLDHRRLGDYVLVDYMRWRSSHRV